MRSIPLISLFTLLWFGATIIGIALISGQYLQWPLIDQLAAIAALSGIGWLMYRTANHGQA